MVRDPSLVRNNGIFNLLIMGYRFSSSLIRLAQPIYLRCPIPALPCGPFLRRFQSEGLFLPSSRRLLFIGLSPAQLAGRFAGTSLKSCSAGYTGFPVLGFRDSYAFLLVRQDCRSLTGWGYERIPWCSKTGMGGYTLPSMLHSTIAYNM